MPTDWHVRVQHVWEGNEEQLIEPEVNSLQNIFSSVSNVHERALIAYVPVDPPSFQSLHLNDRNFVAVHHDTPPHLIDDIIPSILSFCDGPTLARASCVCSGWYAVAMCNDLWENLCRRRFGVSASQMKPCPDPIKRLYIMSHRQMKEVCRRNVRCSNPFTERSYGSSLPTISVPSFRS